MVVEAGILAAAGELRVGVHRQVALSLADAAS
jgi:hypothetical protein